MAIIKNKNISIRQDHAGVLLILPFKFIPHWCKEIALDQILWPALGIAQHPIECASLVINVDDDILMPSGKRQRMGLFIVPHGIIMKPVFLRLTARASHILRQNILIIPLLQNLTGLVIHQHTLIFNRTRIIIKGEDKQIAIS